MELREDRTKHNWHTLDSNDVARELDVDLAQGLDDAEAAHRLERYGPNELIDRGGRGPWQIIWEQLTALMVVILIIAAVISAALGDFEDAAAILAIVILNTLLGFRQEYQAERAMAALKRLSVPQVRVRRSGHVREISARSLVPGDVVLLEAGNFIPADGRLIQSADLRIQEAALTGESEPVSKRQDALSNPDLPLGDRRNMVYMGTSASYGRGVALITATSMRTELGQIAEMIQTVKDDETPLQRRLNQLSQILAGVALVIVAVVFVLGLFRGDDIRLLFLTAVSLAVAAVPEGLPAVVTIALALGAQRMLKRRALIRKLPAVETLGSVTVICSDKTGTLTENRMTVTVLDVAGHSFEINDENRNYVLAHPAVQSSNALPLMLAGGALCNDSVLEVEETGASHGPNLHIVGDPTEGALVMAATRMAGVSKEDLEAVLPRVAEAPFDSDRKRMTTVHSLPTPELRATLSQNNGRASKAGDAPVALDVLETPPQPIDLTTSVLNAAEVVEKQAIHVAFTKGAIDSVLSITRDVWIDGRIEPLDERWRTRILATNDQMASNGIRVLGVGFRTLTDLSDAGQEALERDLTFIGMVGMIDPARSEVHDAVQTCKNAGIRPVMITGDHPLTARNIAQKLGIAADDRVITGPELNQLSEDKFRETIAEVSVYARVSPKHKLQIVQAFQQLGHIVAMTGDGVNDAPALKQADIGVAMGITGTDVSKEAADTVLQDDNFATIVASVEEGRVIYDNIRKFVKYILAGNFAEIMVMLIAPFLGMPLPLLPLQILWVNLVTDGLPGLALGVEPAEPNTMRRPPHPPSENIFARGMGRDLAIIGFLGGALSLGVGFWYWTAGLETWQTMVFTTLTLVQMANALAFRSERESLFRIGLFSNRAVLGAVALTFVLQLAVVYLPFLQRFFETVALTPIDLLVALGASSIVFFGVELKKWILRRQMA